MIPYLIHGGDELSIGFLILGVCCFFGLLILALWVPGAGQKSQYAKDMIKSGYQLIGGGVIGFLFSSWFLAICIIASIFFVIYIFFKGFSILRSK